MLAFGFINPNDWFFGVTFLVLSRFRSFVAWYFMCVYYYGWGLKRNSIPSWVYEMLKDVQIQGLIGAALKGLKVGKTCHR
jgi:hypothetical protein